MIETIINPIPTTTSRPLVDTHRSTLRATRRFRAAALAGAARRGRDVAGSRLLLALTLPLLLLVACLIKLDSRGPVLNRQDRVGLHGRIFAIPKFRSMRTDAEAGGRCWAAEKDRRLTRIGAFIRATRIDELPQLVGVLRGEMSLVGQRPERPFFIEELARIISKYHERAHVLPGITGWAQMNHPFGASIQDARVKLTHDLNYLRNQSLILDLRILLATVRVVLFRVAPRSATVPAAAR
jgi:lipopolysaccharide/colanic/teichoic acid biosynthesis glycosyltransferase